MAKKYDVIIIGAGASGLAAGIYASRARLKTLILEKIAVGGQLVMIDDVENYPGFPKGVNGFELVENMRAQAQRFGAEFVTAEASDIKYLVSDSMFQVKAMPAGEYYANAVIIAAGASPKRLGIKGEMEFQGRGVSYCATCDGPLFKDKEIVVVGGGDTAIGEAIYLTRFAKKVVVVHRRDSLRATKILQERLLETKNVEVKWNSAPTEIFGKDRVYAIKIKDVKTSTESQIKIDGVFVFIGLEPNTDFLKDKLKLDKNGFIITDEDMKTSVEGVYACGDVRKNPLKQIVTSCSEGAIAAYSSCRYLECLKT